MATCADDSSDNTENKGLRCSLCSKTFRKPKSLNCTHSFCTKCLVSHVEKLQEGGLLEDGITCPQEACTKCTPVKLSDGSPDSLVETLPTNLNIVSLIEADQGQEEIDETPIEASMCAPCLKLGTETKASLFCINCNEHQCSQCSEQHSRFRFMTGHTIVSVEQMKNTRKLIVEDFVRCTTHSKTLKFYCQDHSKMCCSTCAFASHRSCLNVDEIAAIADEEKTDAKFRPLKGKIVALKQRINDASTTLESISKDQKCQFDVLPAELEAAAQSIVRMFHELQQRLPKAPNDNALHQERYKELQQKLNVTFHRYESCVNNGSQVQKFIAVEKLSQHYEDFLKETDDCFADVNTLSVHLELTEAVKQVMKERSVGQVMFSRRVINPESFMKRDLKLKKAIDLKRGDNTEHRLITGLTFLADCRLAAVDNKSNDLILFENDLTTLATHKLRYRPLGVTAVKQDEFIITAGNRPMLHYRATDSNQIKQLGSVKGRCKYDSVSFVKEGSYLVGVYGTERPACLINNAGVETKLNINFKQKKYEIDDTQCCYSAATDSVILTEKSTNKVYIYGMSDKSELEVTDPSIVEPRGAAVSSDGCIFVCSGGNNSIVQISPSGSVICTTPCEEMKNVSSVCINTDDSLMVVANNVGDRRQLQIYDM